MGFTIPCAFTGTPMTKRTKKGPRIVTDAQREARKANIVAFNASGEPGAMKHGCKTAAIKNGQLPAGNEDLQALVDSSTKAGLRTLVVRPI